MRIHDNNGDWLRVEQVKGVRGTAADGAVPAAQPAAPVTRTDRVQISDAGRALAARGPDAAGAPLDAERAAAIRERVLQGAYNSLGAVEQVARRMLESGDV